MEFIIICLIFAISPIACTVGGLTYMDDMNYEQRYKTPKPNECNPLYWYPRQIPPHCYVITSPKPKMQDNGMTPLPLPVPVPVPMPPAPSVPIPVPALIPMPAPLPIPAPLPLPIPLPPPPMQFPIYMSAPLLPQTPQILPPNPFLPQAIQALSPNPFLPQSLRFLPYAGFVPPSPEFVSKDGGLNVLPFTDAYSDAIQRRKEKKIRRKLEKLRNDLRYYPRRNGRKHKVLPVISYLRSDGRIRNHRVIGVSESIESNER